MDEPKEFIMPKTLDGFPPAEVANIIKIWREDDDMDEPNGSAFDLLNLIEPYLRSLDREFAEVTND